MFIRNTKTSFWLSTYLRKAVPACDGRLRSSEYFFWTVFRKRSVSSVQLPIRTALSADLHSPAAAGTTKHVEAAGLAVKCGRCWCCSLGLQEGELTQKVGDLRTLHRPWKWVHFSPCQWKGRNLNYFRSDIYTHICIFNNKRTIMNSTKQM